MMRKTHATRVALLTFALFGASALWGENLFWCGSASDCDWLNPANWSLSSSSTSTLPGYGAFTPSSYRILFEREWSDPVDTTVTFTNAVNYYNSTSSDNYIDLRLQGSRSVTFKATELAYGLTSGGPVSVDSNKSVKDSTKVSFESGTYNFTNGFWKSEFPWRHIKGIAKSP